MNRTKTIGQYTVTVTDTTDRTQHSHVATIAKADGTVVKHRCCPGVGHAFAWATAEILAKGGRW